MDKKKVLIVDDDQDLLKMLKLRIEKEGYEFIGAQDGKEMLELVRTKRPDVVLLDVMLPEMDGYSALRELRREDEISLARKIEEATQGLVKRKDLRPDLFE